MAVLPARAYEAEDKLLEEGAAKNYLQQDLYQPSWKAIYS